MGHNILKTFGFALTLLIIIETTSGTKIRFGRHEKEMARAYIWDVARSDPCPGLDHPVMKAAAKHQKDQDQNDVCDNAFAALSHFYSTLPPHCRSAGEPKCRKNPNTGITQCTAVQYDAGCACMRTKLPGLILLNDCTGGVPTTPIPKPPPQTSVVVRRDSRSSWRGKSKRHSRHSSSDPDSS